MTAWALLGAALLVALVLAGCVQSTGDLEERDPPRTLSAPQAEFDETTGAIIGVVVGADLLPIPDVSVGLQSTGDHTTTAADGTFTFSRLLPGEHVVLASKLQYESAAQPVTVGAGEATLAQIQLDLIPVVEPFFQVYQFTGFITCSIGYALVLSEECGTGAPLLVTQDRVGSDPNNKIDWVFNVENSLEFPELQTMHLELTWQPASAAASQLGFHVAHGFTCQEGFCGEDRNFCDVFENYGPPVQTCTVNLADLGIEDPATQLPYDLTARAWAAPSGETEMPNLVAQQPFTMYRTEFYSQGLPAGYTAVASE